MAEIIHRVMGNPLDRGSYYEVPIACGNCGGEFNVRRDKGRAVVNDTVICSVCGCRGIVLPPARECEAADLGVIAKALMTPAGLVPGREVEVR